MKRTPRKICDYVVKVKIQPLKEGGFLATCPELPGVLAEGRTIPEVIDYVEDVIRVAIDFMNEKKIPIPDAIKKTRNKKTFHTELLVSV